MSVVPGSHFVKGLNSNMIAEQFLLQVLNLAILVPDLNNTAIHYIQQHGSFLSMNLFSLPLKKEKQKKEKKQNEPEETRNKQHMIRNQHLQSISIQ